MCKAKNNVLEGETPSLSERIEKEAFERGMMQSATQLFKRAEQESVAQKVQGFMDTESLDSMRKRIASDPKSSPEEKQRLLDQLMAYNEQALSSDDNESAGRATGLASGILLSWLLMRDQNIDPWKKAILGGAITLASGIAGSVVGKNLQSSFYPANTSPVRYNKWKGM